MNLLEISLKLEIIGYGWYRHCKNGALQCFDLPFFRYKKDRVGIVSSQHIVNLNGDKAMGQFVLFVVPLNIDSKVQTIIIRYPEFVPIAKGDIIRIVEPKGSDRVGNRPSCLVHKIGRNAVPPGKLVIGDDTQVVGLVKIGWEKLPIVDAFLTGLTVKFI